MNATPHPDASFQLRATWGTYPFKHASALHDLVVTPDGRGLWAIDDTHASLWDPVRGDVRWSFPLAPVPPSACAISPDGRLLLVGHLDGTLACHDLADGAPRWRIRAVGPGARAVPSVSRISVDPSCRLVATFAPDEREPATTLWDLATGAPHQRLEAPWPLFSPDGKRLLLGGSRLLDVATWQDVASLERRPTAAAAFDRSGARLLVGHDDGSVALWDLGKSSCSWTAQIPALHGGQPPPIRSVWIAPDGAWGYAVTASEVLRLVLSDGRLWDRSGFLGTWRIAATPDGSRLFGISLRGQRLRLFDLAYRLEIRAPYEHEEGILALDVASGGALAVTAGAEGTARLWALQDGYHVRSFPLLAPRAVALSPDGRRVLLVDSVGAHLHDGFTGEHLASFRGFQRRLTRALAEGCFLPDGAVLLRDEAHLLICWDPTSDQERWRQDAHARALQVAEDGASVWVTTDRGTLELRDLRTGAPKESYLVPDRRETHRQRVLPGGGAVLSVQAGVGLVVRPPEGEKARVLRGSEGVAELLAVSPHGSTALAREAGAVSLWDLREGERIQWIDLSGERDEALCGAFHPDGDGFLVGTARGVVLSYRRG